MKARIIFRRLLATLNFAAVVALQGQAQENPAPQPKPAAQATAPVHYDIEIDHGMLRSHNPAKPVTDASLENIVNFLRELHGDVNIVVTPGLDNIQVNELKLHASGMEEELEALRVASGGLFQWRNQPSRNDNGKSTLFYIEPSPLALRQKEEAGATDVKVFNLTGYFARLQKQRQITEAQFPVFERQAVDDTEQIVGETAKSMGLGAPLKFQWHQGANLLVVTGPSKTLEVAAKVINEMIEPPLGDSDAAAMGDQLHRQAAQFDELKAQYAALKARLEAFNTDSVAVERRFSVMGQVQNPGSFSFPKNGSVNIFDAIAMAGGYTRLADPKSVYVRRTENGTNTIDHLDAEKMAHNPTIKPFDILPGDNINVSERNF